MHNEAIIIQHRFSDQLMCVSLAQYRAGSRHRYRDWQLRGTAAFIAPPPLACLPVQAPPPPCDLNALPVAEAETEAEVGAELGDGDNLWEEMAEYISAGLEYDTDAADADAGVGEDAMTLAQCLYATPQSSQGDDYDRDHDHRLY